MTFYKKGGDSWNALMGVGYQGAGTQQYKGLSGYLTDAQKYIDSAGELNTTLAGWGGEGGHGANFFNDYAALSNEGATLKDWQAVQDTISGWDDHEGQNLVNVFGQSITDIGDAPTFTAEGGYQPDYLYYDDQAAIDASKEKYANRDGDGSHEAFYENYPQYNDMRANLANVVNPMDTFDSYKEAYGSASDNMENLKATIEGLNSGTGVDKDIIKLAEVVLNESGTLEDMARGGATTVDLTGGTNNNTNLTGGGTTVDLTGGGTNGGATTVDLTGKEEAPIIYKVGTADGVVDMTQEEYDAWFATQNVTEPEVEPVVEIDPNSLAVGTNQEEYNALVKQANRSSALATLLGLNQNRNSYFNTGTLGNVGVKGTYSGSLADEIATALGQQGTSRFATYEGVGAPRDSLNDAIKKLTGLSNDRDKYVKDAIGTSAGSYNTALDSLSGVMGEANASPYNADTLADLGRKVNNASGSGLPAALTNTTGYDQSAIGAASRALGTKQEALKSLLGQLDKTRYSNVTDMVGRRSDLDDSLSGLNAWDEEGINALIGGYDTLRGDASGYSGGRTQTLRDNIGIGKGNANQTLEDLYGKRDEIGGEAEALYELLGKQNYYGLNDVSDQETVLQILKGEADKWGASSASGNIGYAEDFLSNERDRIKQDQTNVMARNAGSASNMRAYLDSMGLGNSTSLDRFLANTWQGDEEEDPRKNGSFWGDTVNSGFNWL